MGNKQGTPKVRPFFRFLAGFMAICVFAAMGMGTVRVIDNPRRLWLYVTLLGQIWLFLVCAFAAIKGRVPNGLVKQRNE